jgi:hypothetical protein
MAPIESSPNSRALAGWPNALAALSVLALFFALRILDDAPRLAALGVAAIAWAGALAGRIRGRLSADAEGKKLLLLVGAPADALLLVGGALAAWSILGGARGETAQLATGAGVLLLAAGLAITVALELVCGPMRATGVVDNRRVSAAARTAATLTAAVAGLIGLGYGVEKLDVRRDFSFAAPTSPSAATLSMLEAGRCAAPVGEGDAEGDAQRADPPAAASAGGERPEVFLFFERGNTALGEVRDYFDGLSRAGARVTVLDSAADPVLAKALKISKNGTVGFRCGQRTESWTLGMDREDAQKKLNKLDEEVRTRLAKITKDAATVYVTVGHGERSLEEAAKGGERISAKGLKKLIESLNAKVKKLGIGDGLSNEVPEDASLVVVPGPTSAFLPEEANALTRYVTGGGSLLLLLDPPLPGQPDVAASLEPLLAALGTKVGQHEVLNDKAYVKNTGTNADHAFLYSTSFGSHKSVKTLSGARGKAALLFLSATNVDKRAATGEAKVSLIARTPGGSFIDVNGDRAHQPELEARAVLDLAAAVELPVIGASANGAANPAAEGARGEGRAIVVGDSDIVADMIVSQDANAMFAYEALLWLLRDDAKLGGGVAPEEDVPIRHTRDEDILWFYLTIFLGPLLCLGGGLAFVTLKRRRRASARTTGAAAGGAP